MTEKKTAEEILNRQCFFFSDKCLQTVDATYVKWQDALAAMEAYAAQQNPDLGGNVKKFATLHAQQIADKMVEDMRQKLFSMRATKKTMDMLSEADRLITYGYHDCINEMLMWTKSRDSHE